MDPRPQVGGWMMIRPPNRRHAQSRFPTLRIELIMIHKTIMITDFCSFTGIEKFACLKTLINTILASVILCNFSIPLKVTIACLR